MKPMQFALRLAIFGTCLSASPTHAQQKGEPGKFDFYLLNIVPAAEFCKIKDVGPHCVTPMRPLVQHGLWALHGLWAQNNDGTYPVFCKDRSGPAHPENYLDITPDLTLLDHEWKKHGTCTTLAANKFFAAERKAFHAFTVPPSLQHLDHEVAMTPSEVLDLFGKFNPGFPPGSIILWCSEHRLTSVSACFEKDLRPIACQGLKSCLDESIRVAPPAAIKK